MNRTLWFLAGAGAGVYAVAKARRAAEAVTPGGLADRWAALTVGARIFGEEVRAGMSEKETDLRERTPELSGPCVPIAAHAPDKSATREVES